MFFVGDSAGHCLPLSGEGIRTAFYFGIAAGREIRAVLDGEQTRPQALARYGAFSRSTRRPSPTRSRSSALIPRLPPRALTALLSVMGREQPCRRAFELVPGAGASSHRGPIAARACGRRLNSAAP